MFVTTVQVLFHKFYNKLGRAIKNILRYIEDFVITKSRSLNRSSIVDGHKAMNQVGINEAR